MTIHKPNQYYVLPFLAMFNWKNWISEIKVKRGNWNYLTHTEIINVFIKKSDSVVFNVPKERWANADIDWY